MVTNQAVRTHVLGVLITQYYYKHYIHCFCFSHLCGQGQAQIGRGRGGAERKTILACGRLAISHRSLKGDSPTSLLFSLFLSQPIRGRKTSSPLACAVVCQLCINRRAPYRTLVRDNSLRRCVAASPRSGLEGEMIQVRLERGLLHACSWDREIPCHPPEARTQVAPRRPPPSLHSTLQTAATSRSSNSSTSRSSSSSSSSSSSRSSSARTA